MRRTGPDEPCDVAVGRHLARGNLLHGRVDGVEEGFGFFGAGHVFGGGGGVFPEGFSEITGLFGFFFGERKSVLALVRRLIGKRVFVR